MNSELKRHHDALAWDEFEKRNQDLFDLSTLGVASGSDQYLRNRLRHAFDAGLKASREQDAAEARRG